MFSVDVIIISYQMLYCKQLVAAPVELLELAAELRHAPAVELVLICMYVCVYVCMYVCMYVYI